MPNSIINRQAIGNLSQYRPLFPTNEPTHSVQCDNTLMVRNNQF